MRAKISTYIVQGEENRLDSVKWTVEMVGNGGTKSISEEFAKAGKSLEKVLSGLSASGFKHEGKKAERAF